MKACNNGQLPPILLFSNFAQNVQGEATYGVPLVEREVRDLHVYWIYHIWMNSMNLNTTRCMIKSNQHVIIIFTFLCPRLYTFINVFCFRPDYNRGTFFFAYVNNREWSLVSTNSTQNYIEKNQNFWCAKLNWNSRPLFFVVKIDGPSISYKKESYISGLLQKHGVNPWLWNHLRKVWKMVHIEHLNIMTAAQPLKVDNMIHLKKLR